MKTYTSNELTSDRYHSEEFPQASGSILAAIHATCPAEWKYGEPKESDAMGLGTAAHAILLEHDDFARRFARGVDVNDYPDALITNKDLERWLKESGIKGYSGKSKSELIEMIEATGEHPQIFDKIEGDFLALCEENKMIVVPSKMFDAIVKMRTVIFQNGYGELLSHGETEQSVIDEEDGLKCRFDYVGVHGDDAVIVDYKTTSSAHPETFGAQALRMNYWLKMALQYDLFVKAYKVMPRVILLAQSTKAPYVAQAYEITKEQLDIGREQYQAAKRLFDRCKEANVWPAYGGNVQPLQTPSWAARQFGFDSEESIEIIK